MNALKTFVLLVTLSFGTNCIAQTSKIPNYKDGLVGFFLVQEESTVKNHLQLSNVQKKDFDQIISHFTKRKMSTVGSKNKRKKAVKAIQKEQDQTLKTILNAKQYVKYQLYMKQKRAKGYLGTLRG